MRAWKPLVGIGVACAAALGLYWQKLPPEGRP
jgi:hypothetical protein